MTQSYYSINNPHSKGSYRQSPRGLARYFTPYFGAWWIASFLVYGWFVIDWCLTTDFSAMIHGKTTYISMLIIPTVVSAGAVVSRRWWIEWLILLVFILFLLANLMYCRTFMRQIPPECYLMAGNLRGFEASVTASLRWSDLIFAAVWIAAGIAGAALGGKRARRQPPGAYLVLLGLGAAWWIMVLCKRPMSGRVADALESTTRFSTFTPLYSPFAILIYEATQSDNLSAETEAEVARWMQLHEAHTSRYAAELMADSTRVYPSRTLLVIVESLESWPIGLRLGEAEVTPRLNRLIADSAVYYNPNVVTQTRSGRSIDAQLLYLAGMHPPTTGIFSYTRLHRPYQTLATESHRHGINSYLYSSDMPETWNGKNIDTAFGIDSIYMNDRLGLRADHSAGSSISLPYDEDLMASMLGLIAGNPDWTGEGRALGVMVTLSSHAPFNAYKPEFRFPVRPEGCDDNLHDYLSSIHYVDHCLGRLVDSLRSRPGGERTMIAITGDHEAFGARRREIPRSQTYVDRGEHTPLIIINSPYAGRDSTEIGQVDVHAALLDASGLYREAQWRGMGLSPWDRHRRELDPGHPDKARRVSDALLSHPSLWEKHIPKQVSL